MPKGYHLALFAALSAVPTPAIPAPVPAIGSYTFSLNVGGSVATIPYDANLPLTGVYPQIDRIVVLLHGSSRSSANAHDTLLEGADIANDDTSLLLAPQFLIEDDIVAHALPPQALFWSDSGWKEGDRSLSTPAHPRSVRLSSFAIMDSMIARAASRAPNAGVLVVAGHSAGGQFVHRFAAGSTVSDAVLNAFGVQVSYVVANPSSYLYLNSERVVAGTQNLFAVPPSDAVQACSWFNDYKYGLQNRNSYMSQLSSSQIVARYRDARVAVLLGERDNDPAGPELDTTCAAQMQGSNRLERGIVHGFYVRHLFGPSIAARHRTVIVPGVGHDANAMFTSPCGVAELFGAGACDPVDAEANAIDNEAAPARPLLASRPNPFRRQAAIAYRLVGGGRAVSVDVYDARGARVRTLRGAADTQGRGTLVWNGRSNAGEPLAAGVYWLRLEDGAATAVERVILLR